MVAPSDASDLDNVPVARLRSLPWSDAVRDEVVRWLNEPRYRDERPGLWSWVERALAGQQAAIDELDDAFGAVLPIGTAGRRGAVGAGPNRMNTIVIRETAHGLAGAMRARGWRPSVAVVFDTRRDSRAFAHVVARQLAALDLEVTVVDRPRPTPLLSHMVRARGCGAGVVISASHNPPGDNGIKVFGPVGAQILGADSSRLMEAIERAGGEPLVPLADLDDERITLLASDAELASVDDPYLGFVSAQGVADPHVVRQAALRVVFTPLHGVGHHSVVPVLAARGIDVHMLEAQGPDGGEFSTLPSANPETEDALSMARARADEIGADLVLATDPDADRIGALVRDADGTLRFVDGNRLAVIMLDHVLRELGASVPSQGWVLTTVCTTPLVGALARAVGVEAVDDLLVGFKHHAGMMAEQPDKTCVFATEEAHGYLRGDDVHDKDGAVAALLLAEAAAVAKGQGRTLFDRLDEVWTRLGYHRERTENLYAYGRSGAEAIARLMKVWRQAPPTELGGWPVARCVDRQQGQQTGSPTRDLPGNVLVFEFATRDFDGIAVGARLVIRPSGTEPKAKIYALARAEGGDRAISAQRRAVDDAIDRLLLDARQRADTAMA